MSLEIASLVQNDRRAPFAAPTTAGSANEIFIADLSHSGVNRVLVELRVKRLLFCRGSDEEGLGIDDKLQSVARAGDVRGSSFSTLNAVGTMIDGDEKNRFIAEHRLPAIANAVSPGKVRGLDQRVGGVPVQKKLFVNHDMGLNDVDHS
jgi:hypothetical protein